MLNVVVGKKKRPVGAEEVKWENMSGEELGSLAATDSLFGGTRVLVFTGALNGPRGEEFLKFAKDFAQSGHAFIFEEEKLLKRETDIVTKAGGKVEKIETVKKERGFDPHGLTFALGSRDKKKLWLGLTAALGEGEKPEAVAGLLHWKVRDMLSKGAAGKYTREEMKGLSRELISLYHDSHRGLGDLELLLERFALKL
jgi:DNA polymerase III delta subunit